MAISKIGSNSVDTLSSKLTLTAADGVEDNDYIMELTNAEATDGRSYGLRVKAGSTSADQSFVVQDHDASNTLLKVTGDGDVNVGIGDILFGTAGKGINLGVTSNTDSNTLDDYEEGTWTAGSAVGSINGSNVHYTKVGRLVHFTVKGSFANSSNNEDIEITGLPFAPAVNQAAGQAMWRDLGTVGQGGIAYVTTGSRILFFTEGATASAHDGLRHNEMGSSNEVVLSGTYFT